MTWTDAGLDAPADAGWLCKRKGWSASSQCCVYCFSHGYLMFWTSGPNVGLHIHSDDGEVVIATNPTRRQVVALEVAVAAAREASR